MFCGVKGIFQGLLQRHWLTWVTILCCIFLQDRDDWVDAIEQQILTCLQGNDIKNKVSISPLHLNTEAIQKMSFSRIVSIFSLISTFSAFKKCHFQELSVFLLSFQHLGLSKDYFQKSSRALLIDQNGLKNAWNPESSCLNSSQDRLPLSQLL